MEWNHGRKLYEQLSTRTLGRMFRVQLERMFPELVNDVIQVRLATMQREGNWKAVISELGKDVKIPDLWRISALLEICPRDVKEQMLMRLDEVGENYDNFKAKVVSYTTNKTEQKHKEGTKRRKCRWRWTTLSTANQKRRSGE